MNQAKRLYLSDTGALVLFGIVMGITTVIYEIWLVSMTTRQWVLIRILYNILRFVGARLCGKITDRTRCYILKGSKSKFKKGLADGIALSFYQMPIYIFSALVAGAGAKQIAIVVSLYVLDNLVSGWLYGLILDWMRARVASQKLV